MRKSFARYETTVEVSSTDDDFSCLTSDIDLLNPRVFQADRSKSDSRRKLFNPKLQNDEGITFQRNSSGHGKSENKNEHQVTFAEDYEGQLRSPGTPRILKVIRQHSGKLSVKPDVSPQLNTSKSSALVFYDDFPPLESGKSSKNRIRLSRSEQTIYPPSIQASGRVAGISPNPGRPSKAPGTRRRRPQHRSRRRTPLNVNIIHKNPCHLCKSNAGDSKLMARALSAPQKLPEVDRRVFPFQATPSGNLKIIPNQVVFESKKVSVLVADPRHTKVNVKADNSIEGVEDIQKTRQPLVDLPPGVTPSTIDQLQAQNKLPAHIGPEYLPRTRPHRLRQRPGDMELKQGTQIPTIQRLTATHDVPLSSLGFKSDNPINWRSVTLPEKTDLYVELARRITNYTNADCIVRLGHDEFHCHLLVLQSYSTFFDEKNCKEIDLTGCSVTSRAFSIIYDWMISPTAESCHLLRRDNILEIFKAAQYLGIKDLEEQCWAFIDNNELFSEDTAFFLYLDAKKIGNTAVMELMVPRIMKFFLLLVSTKDFLELSVDELCLLLRSNYICVNSEMEVLMSAVRWLMYDWDSRRQYMLEVLKCVRFGLITPWQLIDVKRNPENPEFMELMSYPEVQKMVDDALAFVIIKYWYGAENEDYYRWIDVLGLTEPTNRNWTGKEKNYVTYREFLVYLNEYPEKMLAELRGETTNCGENGETSMKSRGNCGGNLACSCESLPAGENGNSIIDKGSKLPKAAGGGPRALESGGIPPEFLSKYLSNLTSQPKLGTGDAENGLRDSNAVNFDIWRAAVDEIPRENDVKKDLSSGKDVIGVEVHCQRNSELNEFSSRENKTSPRHPGAKSIPGDDSESARTNQSYKVHSKLSEMRKSASTHQNQTTKKIADLLSVSNIGNKLYNSPPKRITQSTISGNAENHPRGHSSPRRRRKNSPMSRNKNRINAGGRANSFKDPGINQTGGIAKPDEEKISKRRDISMENKSINQAESKPIQTIKSPVALSYNFVNDERMSSPRSSPSDNNTDTEIDEGPINKYHRQDKDDYPADYSLFFRDREGLLILGGTDPHVDYGTPGNTGRDIYRYNPMENTWEFVGEIPEPRHHHSLAYLNGRVYLVGGADPRDEILQRGTATANVWSYDPATRKWFNQVSMMTPRKNFGLVVLGGRIYAIGGQDSNGSALKSIEAFDPVAGAWQKMQPMQTARIGPACVKFQNAIWVAGGMTKSKYDPLSKEVECYDPAENIWRKMVPLRSPRCYATLSVISNCLCIIGGAGKPRASDNMTESIETIDMWDPSTRAWRQFAEMTTARHSHSTAMIGSRLLIIGGITTVHMQTLNSVESLCCERNKWIQGVAPLPYAISGHASVTLPRANTQFNA